MAAVIGGIGISHTPPMGLDAEQALVLYPGLTLAGLIEDWAAARAGTRA